MKVKIGESIHDASDEPIMLILSKGERDQIGNMPPDCEGKYFMGPSEMNSDQVKIFMD
jgi:hypothetical protein